MLMLACGVSLGASGLKNENLLVSVPVGYKIAFSDRKPGLLVSEMIPDAQSLEDWKDMLTVQIYYSRQMKMSVLEAAYTQTANPACKEHNGALVGKGHENGYEYGLFISSCSTTPASKSETVLTKAILGEDSTYFIIKSWRSVPDKDEIVKWSRYMKGVKVCDSRIAERACP
ncbi:hypothetical protein GCM10007094_30500 [Pseudovibrio japonicus]|uniref:Lipoprotein n=1 Tax=Pseudovibrio japonicus TaxID=366534 RepID=A0ABQ3EN20_9HYPH|nr:hypothetical protein GCM10007094_30500 [Pseudovibrio japonicus]